MLPERLESVGVEAVAPRGSGLSRSRAREIRWGDETCIYVNVSRVDPAKMKFVFRVSSTSLCGPNGSYSRPGGSVEVRVARCVSHTGNGIETWLSC